MVETSLKRIIIFTLHFAPAYKAGGIVRSLENLVLNFGKRFEFWIVTGNTDIDEGQPMAGIIQNSWVSFSDNTKVMYLSGEHRQKRQIGEIFQTIQPEIVYINGMFSIPFVIFPIWVGKKSPLKPVIIIAPNGMLHSGNLSVKPIKKKIYFLLFKVLKFHQNIRWHATDRRELQDIKKMFGTDAEIKLANILPKNLIIPPLQSIEKKSTCLKLITVSLIIPNKGHLRILESLKELQDKISVEYHIYGAVRDANYWKSCQEQIKLLNSSIKVVYHGFIDPSQITATLNQYHFFILPTQGENFSQAIYEALSAGRPVIISDQTPWKNLAEHQAGWDVDLGDKKLLTNAIAQAYHMDQATYDTYCLGAKRVAQRYLNESGFVDQYEKLFSPQL